MNKNKIIISLLVFLAIFIGFKVLNKNENKENINVKGPSQENTASYNSKNKSEIYLAGGCFWGVEGYFKKIPGVIDTEVGYANGKTSDTSYEKIGETNHSETVKVTYDSNKLSLQDTLEYYFRIIDPTSVNKQGNDVGSQYRTGIYYTNENDKLIIDEIIRQVQGKYDKKIAVEVEKSKISSLLKTTTKIIWTKIQMAIAISI